MENKIKKLTLTFNLNASQDKELWEALEEISKQLKQRKIPKAIKKSELLKTFIRPMSGKEILSIQRNLLTHADRMEIWRQSYNQEHNSHFPLSEFIVKVMPKLKEKDLSDLEIKYFQEVQSEETSDVPVA